MIGSHIKELKPGSGKPKEIGFWEVLWLPSLPMFFFVSFQQFFEDERSAQIYKGLSAQK